MNKKSLLVAVAVVFLCSSIALAAAPTAWVESAQIVGAGKQIKVYRVPTRDENGKIKYYDLTINLPVEPDGTIAATSPIASVKSPNVFGNKFVAGRYTDSAGYVSQVGVSTLNGGRMQGSLSGKSGYGDDISMTWATGPIAGHPFEVDLQAAGIDKISGAENYAWGKVGYSDHSSAWGGFSTGDIISAVQTGNSIAISGYDKGNTQVCGVTLVKK